MNFQPILNDTERELLLDLLMREQRELPPEIHRTHKHEPHESLEDRQKVVNSLIERLQDAPLSG